MLADVVREAIHAVAPEVRLVRLLVPPVVGGVVLGMEQGGLQPSAVRQALIESTARLLRYDEWHRPQIVVSRGFQAATQPMTDVRLQPKFPLKRGVHAFKWAFSGGQRCNGNN